MIKKMRKRLNNKGNSFIMVIATISFLSVLVAAILVAVAMCYRLKAIDINARDNFYYLEQAMDEIYAGVGADCMTKLNKAYDETVEVLVYYDTDSKSYVTMKNDDANKLLKDTFMSLVQNDAKYTTANIGSTLLNYLSNPYDASSNPEGVELFVGNVSINADGDEVTVKDIVLKRTAKYSTVNTVKGVDAPVQDTFIQTLTTDLVIGEPGFNVNFSNVSSDLSVLYAFSMVSDMGIEIQGSNGAPLSEQISITGNVYAASDFYNKEYNQDTDTQVYKSKTYDTAYNGLVTDSKYSGIYVNGADLMLTSDKVIVPGTIAAVNCADITIASVNQASDATANVWADGIALDGYTQKNVSDTYVSSSINMRANAYISDDLELNANYSSFVLTGGYYGYSNSTTDNREFTAEASSAVKRTADLTPKSQRHYNSSAIIMNGKETTLDLSNVDNMYIAGQTYIETTKKQSEVEYTISTGTTEADGSESKADVVTNEYTYVYDDTMQNSYTKVNGGTKSVIQDIKTGEAVSIKSNQLAYIPNGVVTEDASGDYYVSLSEELKVGDVGNFYKGFWDDLGKIPVVKTVISGKSYYFFDFSNVDTKNKQMSQFIEEYAQLFENSSVSGLTDITDYDHFKVKLLDLNEKTTTSADGTTTVDELQVYSNAAITTTTNNTFKIVSKGTAVSALNKAAEHINDALAAQGSTETVSTSQTDTVLASAVTTKLQQQYKEMKYLLTNINGNPDSVNAAHSLDESQITPINYFFDFRKLTADENIVLPSGYRVWLSDGDITIGDSNVKGNLRGLIIAKGDVTFSSDVTGFEGLIVTAGKIKIDHKMSLMANEEIIKTILRECDESNEYKTSDPSKYHANVCELFNHFQSNYAGTVNADGIESMKTISSVEYEDILDFRNWKKNVD